MNHQYRLIEATDPDLQSEIFRLRARAWQAREPGFPATLDAWTDDVDAISEHFAVMCGDDLAAAARLTIVDDVADGPDTELYVRVPESLPSPIGFISRLVVCPNHRKTGLPAKLDDIRLRRARQAGCQTMLAWTSAGDGRERQLHQHGFEPIYRTRYRSGPLTKIGQLVVMILRF